MAPLLAVLVAGCSDDEVAPAEASAGSASAAASSSGSGGGGGPPCGAPIEGARCIEGGWCWDVPRPVSMDVHAIHGAPDGAVSWAVGSLGVALHRCGDTWTAVDTGTTADLHGVWHPDPATAFAVGDGGTVLRWDGQQWERLQADTYAALRGVWGSAADDVWIAGDHDTAGVTLFHWDGVKLARVLLPHIDAGTLLRVVGRDAEDVYALGAIALHFDGRTWKRLPWPAFADDLALDAVITADRLVARFGNGTYESIQAWASNEWTWLDDVSFKPRYETLHLSAAGEARAIDATTLEVLRVTDTKVERTDEYLPGPARVVWAPPQGATAWAGGEAGLLLTGDGTAWAQDEALQPFPAAPLDYAYLTGTATLMDGPSDDNLWALAAGGAARRTESGWAAVSLPWERSWFGSVDPSGGLYVVPENGFEVQVQMGSGWESVPGPGQALHDLHAFAHGDIWGQIDDGLVHFDGLAWTPFDTPCSPLEGAESVPPEAGTPLRAPTGETWILGSSRVFRVDAVDSAACAWMASESGPLESDSWTGLAWSGSSMWALTRHGKLYRRVGNALALQADLALRPSMSSTWQLATAPDGTLRVGYTAGQEKWVGTLDPVTGMATGEPTPLPPGGAVWLRGSALFAAAPGSVLRLAPR